MKLVLKVIHKDKDGNYIVHVNSDDHAAIPDQDIATRLVKSELELPINQMIYVPHPVIIDSEEGKRDVYITNYYSLLPRPNREQRVSPVVETILDDMVRDRGCFPADIFQKFKQ